MSGIFLRKSKGRSLKETDAATAAASWTLIDEMDSVGDEVSLESAMAALFELPRDLDAGSLTVAELGGAVITLAHARDDATGCGDREGAAGSSSEAAARVGTALGHTARLVSEEGTMRTIERLQAEIHELRDRLVFLETECSPTSGGTRSLDDSCSSCSSSGSTRQTWSTERQLGCCVFRYVVDASAVIVDEPAPVTIQRAALRGDAEPRTPLLEQLFAACLALAALVITSAACRRPERPLSNQGVCAAAASGITACCFAREQGVPMPQRV